METTDPGGITPRTLPSASWSTCLWIVANVTRPRRCGRFRPCASTRKASRIPPGCNEFRPGRNPVVSPSAQPPANFCCPSRTKNPSRPLRFPALISFVVFVNARVGHIDRRGKDEHSSRDLLAVVCHILPKALDAICVEMWGISELSTRTTFSERAWARSKRSKGSL